MKYSDWKNLSAQERKNIGWHRHPHIKTATLYSIAFFVTAIIIIFGISKNSVVHINRKPTSKEAFESAKIFVRERLKQPGTASFPDNNFSPVIDTTTNSYQIKSTVKSIDANGQTTKSNWTIKMTYKGGDWSERNSWQVQEISLGQ
ncbi:hypothetical protein [Mucilaginibacter flavus]|uniref:hypothetical protein n=1 Tax=Mucilaginibacter flavus TaxID=931504 RepID=UPI0025B5C8EB|nr:hypothetical protein [Mucilaginibacter flavus]MDN3580268.1 hypothetical protein [Mucilaginibacter flavus]